MNNLVQIREKIKKEERIHKARLLATKNGAFLPYKRSVFEERLKEAKNMVNLD